MQRQLLPTPNARPFFARALLVASALLICGWLAAGVSEAQQPPPKVGERGAEADEGNQREARHRERRERNRARWAKLSPERRAELRRVHEALRKLEPEKREALKAQLRALAPERAKKLLEHRDRFRRSSRKDEIRHRHEVLRRFESDLSPAERERVTALPHREFRKFIEARMDERLAELRETLPAAEQAQFDTLDRRQKLDRLRRRHFEEALARHRAELTPEELTAFDALDRREQMHELRSRWRRERGGPEHHGGWKPRGPRGDHPGGPGERRGPPGERRGPPGERRGPPPLPEWLESHRTEWEELPRRAIYQFIRKGTLPSRVEVSSELRTLLEGLDEDSRAELEEWGRPRRSEPFERPSDRGAGPRSEENQDPGVRRRAPRRAPR